MKFLADMGISPATVAMLRTLGHEAKHLHDEKLHRLSDADVLEKARAEAAIVLTHDLDFGALMAASGERLPSVVIFRLPDMRPTNVNRHMASILAQHSADLEHGALLSVSERRIRVRHLPIA